MYEEIHLIRIYVHCTMLYIGFCLIHFLCEHYRIYFFQVLCVTHPPPFQPQQFLLLLSSRGKLICIPQKISLGVDSNLSVLWNSKPFKFYNMHTHIGILGKCTPPDFSLYIKVEEIDKIVSLNNTIVPIKRGKKCAFVCAPCY